jgi:hypothetical protein
MHENEDPAALDHRLIDMLVDGSLSDAERRRVLARLEVEPDAWRRCALAFLEAQSWREALGMLTGPLSTSGSLPVPVPPSVPEQGGGRHLNLHPKRRLAAVAAGLLAAFALGWSARGVPHAAAPHGVLAKVENRAVVGAPSPPRLTHAPESPRPEPIALPQRPVSPRLPEPVLRAWERRGYQVDRSQRLVSMKLKDGRRLAVPIDEVRLRYVGDRTY